MELHSKELLSDEMEAPKKKDTYLQKRDNKLLTMYDNIIMEYQKIADLLDNVLN